MKTIKLLALGLLIGLGSSAFAANAKTAVTSMQPGEWEKLGSRVVNMAGDHDEIIVTVREGLFTKVRLKIMKAPIHLKNINIILNNLKKIGAYPYNRKQVTEEYSHIKIKVIAFIFNNRLIFYTLLYPLRVLYKMKLIKLP